MALAPALPGAGAAKMGRLRNTESSSIGKSFFKPQLCILHHFHHMYCTCLLGLKE